MAQTIRMDDGLLWLRTFCGRAGGRPTQGSAQPALALPALPSATHCLGGPLVVFLQGGCSSSWPSRVGRARVGSRSLLERKRMLFSQKQPASFSSHLTGLNLVSWLFLNQKPWLIGCQVLIGFTLVLGSRSLPDSVTEQWRQENLISFDWTESTPGAWVNPPNSGLPLQEDKHETDVRETTQCPLLCWYLTATLQTVMKCLLWARQSARCQGNTGAHVAERNKWTTYAKCQLHPSAPNTCSVLSSLKCMMHECPLPFKRQT